MAPGVIDEHLLAGAVLLPQHQVEFLQPPPVEIAEAAVAVAVRVGLAVLLPEQLQGDVFVGLQFPMNDAKSGGGYCPAGRAATRSGNSGRPTPARPGRRSPASSLPSPGRPAGTRKPCSARWNNWTRSGAGSVRGNGAAELLSACAWSTSLVAIWESSTFQWSPGCRWSLQRAS